MGYGKWETVKAVHITEGTMPVIVALCRVDGVDKLDIRKHYTDDSGKLAPTQKGVLLEASLAGDLIAAIQEVLDLEKED